MVGTFLTNSGLSVATVAPGNRWVDATGTVAQVDQAFGTTLTTYTWQGQRLRAPSGPLTVPTYRCGYDPVRVRVIHNGE